MQYTPERNNLPIGMQSFEKLRKKNCVYVDKTEHIYNLVTKGSVYFLSRPRRFGKSLLISTLEALFKDKSEFFKGTWIAASGYQWSKHPVIRVDMTQTNKKSTELFNASLIKQLLKIAKAYQVEFEVSDDASEVLTDLILSLEAEFNKVVVLIDEYDKPILDNIINEPLAEEMRNTLRQFYSTLKAQDENLRFVMLTGITKFSKVSVFSGLNNLKDITMTSRYAAICGYTQAELENTFSPWIERLARKLNSTVGMQLDRIKLWYNGYRFSKEGQLVYNPFSTLNLFDDLDYEPYWHATGTPNPLIDLIKAQGFSLSSINSLLVDVLDLEIHDVPYMGIIPLLYQTGYLTIKDYNRETENYTLGYPNHEVDRAFSRALFMHFAGVDAQARVPLIDEIVASVKACEYDTMFQAMQTFFAGVPYYLHGSSEKYYHNLFYLIFHLVGLKISAEVATSLGRMDAMIELGNKVLIFELKINQSAEIALQQIHDKRYYEPYQKQSKEIILFGVNFSTTERNISDWQQETLNQ